MKTDEERLMTVAIAISEHMRREAVMAGFKVSVATPGDVLQRVKENHRSVYDDILRQAAAILNALEKLEPVE